MGRRPEPESFDAEPPEAPIRPGDGYRVGARISAGDTGRTRLAGAIAVGIVLAGIAFAAIGPTLPQLPALPVAPVPSHSVATALPDIAIERSAAPSRFVPVYGGGLRWLDPATGSMSGDPYTAARAGLFVDSDGHGLCVCLEIPWSQDRLVTRVTLRRYSVAGVEVARVTLDELESVERGAFGDPIQVDAAISRDGRDLWIAHAVRAEKSWEVGLDRVDLSTLEVRASVQLDPVPMPAFDAAGILVSPAGWVTHEKSALRATLRVSPDGSLLSVLLGLQSEPGLDPGLPSFQEERLVIPSSLATGSVALVAVPVHDASLETCDSELSAWATMLQFVTVCSRPEGEGVQPYVRIESPGDITREVTVGPPVGTHDAEWLLDAEAGVLYRWSTLAHVFTRLEVATRGMATLAIDAARTGTGSLSSWPNATDASAPWAPLVGPNNLFHGARLAGSADGTVIYALGFRSVADAIRDDRIASTGIWVLNAVQPRVIARWAPVALYDQIGFTPGREWLVTLALPGSDGNGAPADWSTSLRFHDPSTGEVIETLGDVVETSGYVPAILAPNAAQGIAGF